MRRLTVVLAAVLLLTGCSAAAEPGPEDEITPADRFHALLAQDSPYWDAKSVDSTYAVAKDVCRLLDGGYSAERVTEALIAEEGVPDQAAADFVAEAQGQVC